MFIRNLLWGSLLFLLTFCSSKPKDYVVTLQTNFGDIRLVLHDKTAKHKENFIKLVEEGFYDGVLFHRVIENFMIQAGDFSTKENAEGKAEDYNYTIPAEFNEEFFHERGAIAAARQPDQVNPEKASSGTQFYIVQGNRFTEEQLSVNLDILYFHFRQMLLQDEYQSLAANFNRLQQEQKFDSLQALLLSYKDTVEQRLDVNVDNEISEERMKVYTTVGGAPHLDDSYTVFGKVVEGMEVVDKIAAQPTRSERPVNAVRIEKAVVEKMNRDKITSLYGYEYPE